jgi:phosphatidate cytidylyltransferase
MLKQRVVTALLLGIGVLLAIFLLPDWAWGILIGAVITLALWEWCTLVKVGRLGFALLALLCTGSVVYCGFVPLRGLEDGRLLMGVGYALAVTFWIFSAPTFLYFKLEPAGWYWRYGVAVLLTVPTGIATLELKHASPALLLAAVLVVCLADICAFFTGRAFGKHKLAPEISPGKTWEGVAGAVVGVLVFCVAVWFTAPAVAANIRLYWLLLLALVYVLVSVMGDLFESLVKREAGVKDSGTLLPGHGGVLDRIDAMLAFFPFAGATLLVLQ